VSNKGDIIALVPGASGWEIWEGPPPSGFTRKEVTQAERAGELDNPGAADLVMFFPVKDATVMPFKTTTSDESLFAELAQMHSERMGIRADPGAGQLIDEFVIEKGEESAVLATVVLRSPVEGDLPVRSPKEFDYSPRAYSFSGDGIAVWKEFSHWVFAFYQDGKMLYAQSTSNDQEHPDEALLRDIKLAIVQLSFQGISFSPKDVRVWHPAGELGEAGALGHAFGFQTSVGRRPDPVMSKVPSKLLPADVHAERRAAAKRRQITGALAIAAALVLGFLGWGGWTLWRDIRATNELIAEAAKVQPEADAFNAHKSRWAELGPLVDEEQWPVETLFRITRCIAPGSRVRLREAQISNNELRIKGQCDQAPPIGALSLAINKSDQLRRFKFNAAPPSNTAKGWEFAIEGTVPHQQQ